MLLRHRAADIEARAANAVQAEATLGNPYNPASVLAAAAVARAHRPRVLELELAATVRRALPLDT